MQIQGWCSPQEQDWLAKQAAQRQTIVEVGVWKGRSCKILCDHCPGLVIGVDHWLGSVDEEETFSETTTAWGRVQLMQQVRTNLGEYVDAGKLVLIRASSVRAAHLVNYLIAFSAGLDMVYLDGSHDEKSAKEDIRTWQPMLRPGGLLCGHDRNREGVKAALEELVPNRQDGPGGIWYAGKG